MTFVYQLFTNFIEYLRSDIPCLMASCTLCHSAQSQLLDPMASHYIIPDMSVSPFYLYSWPTNTNIELSYHLSLGHYALSRNPWTGWTHWYYSQSNHCHSRKSVLYVPMHFCTDNLSLVFSLLVAGTTWQDKDIPQTTTHSKRSPSQKHHVL